MMRLVPLLLLALAVLLGGCDSSTVEPPPDPPPDPVCEPTPVPAPTGPEGRLLFTDAADGRLYSARPDGSDLRDHTPSNVAAFAAVWSPDRSRIAFLSGDSLLTTAGNALFVMDADDPESAEVLHLRPGTSDPIHRVLRGSWLAWSPDGRYVAARVCRAYAAGCLGADIAVVDVEADTLGWLTEDPEDDNNPVWNRTSMLLAYRSRDLGAPESSGLLYQYYSTTDGGQEQQLTESENGIGGAINSDWTHALTYGIGYYGLWDLGCQEFSPLDVSTSAWVVQAVWSPDGSRYAGIDYYDEDRGLYVVDARTGQTTKPFPDRPLITYVDWR